MKVYSQLESGKGLDVPTGQQPQAHCAFGEAWCHLQNVSLISIQIPNTIKNYMVRLPWVRIQIVNILYSLLMYFVSIEKKQLTYLVFLRLRRFQISWVFFFRERGESSKNVCNSQRVPNFDRLKTPLTPWGTMKAAALLRPDGDKLLARQVTPKYWLKRYFWLAHQQVASFQRRLASFPQVLLVLLLQFSVPLLIMRFPFVADKPCTVMPQVRFLDFE